MAPPKPLDTQLATSTAPSINAPQFSHAINHRSFLEVVGKSHTDPLSWQDIDLS